MEYWVKPGISIMMILVISVSYTATVKPVWSLLCHKVVIDGKECPDNKKCPVNDSCDDPSQCPCMDGYNTTTDKPGNRIIISCDDIQECIEDIHNCSTQANCNNTDGGYFCECNKGFRRGNETKFCPSNNITENQCSDIDECKEDPYICAPHGTCKNIDGSYWCDCMSGFTNSSHNCTDINECKENPQICEPYGDCKNTIGSYTCECREGYQNISNNCTDINECKTNPNICGLNSDCGNTVGSYMCVCRGGFKNIVNQCTECTSNATEREFLKHCANQTIMDPFCSVLDVPFSFLDYSCQNNNRNITKEKAKEELKQTAENLSQALANHSVIAKNVQRGRFITAFLQSVERVVLISFLEAQSNQHINTSELDITLKPSHDICSSGVQSFTLVSVNNSMEVPCSLVSGERDGAILITYKEFNFFNGNYPGQNNKAVINSKVVTGAITNPDSKSLRSPVTLRLSHLQPLQPLFKFICVFWDPVRDGWSDKGCETEQSNGTHTNCSCTHLSSFALLMSPHEIQEDFNLTILSYLGLSISLVCLCLSLLTFILCRTLRNAHTSILSALCGCLFLGQLLFMVGIHQTWNKLLCAFIAGGLQFLFLCAFCWMSIESVLLFMTVRNLRAVNYMASRKSNFQIMCLLGFGVPSVIVGISAAVRPHEYSTEKNCWLGHGIVWSFLGPVCAFITINMILLVLTFWLLKKRMASLNTNVSTLKNTRLMSFKAVAQFFILGCTWGIGYFKFGPQSLVISYLFTICNSLQGVYIFLVHCLLNQQVREEYRKLLYKLCTQNKQKQDTTTTSTLQSTSKRVAAS
ncbi:adhesion G protein-coupled receptor E3-like isoform X2 [Aquarana catesbeiana]|uniref:adhesion G protein-coupled receptor E3-like isoform X2 n=1 Tax=Aquarana catesbeiana TaxID=8400 RepID=UPI003CC949CE